MTLLMGASQVDITPQNQVPLAGFATREGNMEGIHSRLYLKTFLFESNNQATLILIGDLIWWDGMLVEEWKKKIFDRFSILPSAVCFHATHNHSGPQTSDKFTPFLGVHDEKYIALLEDKIFEGIESSYKNKEIVVCKVVKSTCDLAVNRRRKKADRIIMQPNFEGVCDSDLSIILFENIHQQMKGIFVHYSCHPTCTDVNILSSEYAGHCCSLINQTFETAVVGFLQGCCGDVRPTFIKDNKFYKGTLKEMEVFGAQLAGKVLAEISNGELEILSDEITSDIKHVPLMFKENYHASNEFRLLPDVLATWELYKVKYDTFVNLEIQKINIGRKLIIFAFNGEMVQEYGRFLKNINPNVLPIGYSNGMVGYISTATQLQEGGYEAEDFIYYFGLPAPFEAGIEERIKSEIKMMIKGE